MMRVRLILLVLLLAGCATHWTKPGVTRQEYERDHGECDQEAYLFGYVYSESHYRQCMAARGYTSRARD